MAKVPCQFALARWNAFLATLEGKTGEEIHHAYMAFLEDELRDGRVSQEDHDEWMRGVKEIKASGMMQIYHAIVTGQRTLEELMPAKH